MSTPLPGLPLVESPLFPAIAEQMELTDEEKRIGRDLFEQGYAVFDFPDSDLDQRIERIKDDLAPQFRVDLTSPDSDKTVGERRLQDAWKTNPDVKAIAANETVIALLSKLYGRQAFPFQTLNFPVGTQQDAHTDIVHFSSLPEKFMCGVWLAMEDVHADAGPLFYYPGSHRWPVLNNAIIGRSGYQTKLASAQHPFSEAWDAICAVHKAQPATFLARKGQALIWLANLLHGGSAQHDPRLTRWSQVTHYYFDDCIYYTPAYSDEALGRLDMRKIYNLADNTFRPNLYHGQMVKPGKGLRLSRKAKNTGILRGFEAEPQE